MVAAFLKTTRRFPIETGQKESKDGETCRILEQTPETALGLNCRRMSDTSAIA